MTRYVANVRLHRTSLEYEHLVAPSRKWRSFMILTAMFQEDAAQMGKGLAVTPNLVRRLQKAQGSDLGLTDMGGEGCMQSIRLTQSPASGGSACLHGSENLCICPWRTLRTYLAHLSPQIVCISCTMHAPFGPMTR